MYALRDAKSMPIFFQKMFSRACIKLSKIHAYNGIYELYCCKFVNLINVQWDGLQGSVWLKEDPWKVSQTYET